MGQLYEEYLSSNEDWMSSSLVVNADRKLPLVAEANIVWL
jgi:hypothetical protein